MRIAPALILTFALAAAACRATAPPPRSPLADTSTARSAPSASVIPPGVTSTALPRGTEPPTSAEVEPAVAKATALLAEWLAIPQRDLALVRAEAVAWPSTCLGIDYPGFACASVVTPGFRVLLRDPAGGLHTLHLDAGAGSVRWAGEVKARGRITALDRSTQRVTVDVDGKPLVLRVVPGTFWLPDIAGASALGALVALGYDPAGNASMPAVAAWVALAS